MPYPYQNPYGAYPQPNYGGFGNPYQLQQPIQPQPASMPQQPQQNTYAFVNGIEGAKSYPMQPNQTVMLMDSENPIAYMKSANSMGQATLKYFKLVETSEAELRGSASKADPTVEYATRADLNALAKKVEELSKPKTAE